MTWEFAYYTSLVKRIAKEQLVLDKQFAKDFLALRSKMYAKKISGPEFWAQYKKLLLESVGGNKKLLQELLEKTDKEMKARFKEAEKQPKEERPPLDLRLPE